MQNQHVYNSYRQFPELHKTRKEAAELEEINRSRIYIAEKTKTNRQLEQKSKLPASYIKKNSEKICSENKKLSHLCRVSVVDELKTMNNFTKTLHENRISQRRSTSERNLSFIYTKQDSHPYYANNTINSRPATVHSRNMHPSFTDLDLKHSNSNARSGSPKNNSTRRADSPKSERQLSSRQLSSRQQLQQPETPQSFKSFPSPPQSPKQQQQQHSQESALQAVCDKLSRAGFSLNPHISCAENITDCGLLTVLSSGANRGLFHTQSDYYNKNDLQSRLLIVLGIKLTATELDALYDLLFAKSDSGNSSQK